MRGCNDGGTGGQWIDAWELHGATWMLIGRAVLANEAQL